MTPGQHQALYQIEEIARVEPHLFDIEDIREPTSTAPWLRVTVSFLIGQIPMTEDGLHLREREVFDLFIPAAFPFRKPEVWVPHDRFAGKPHVQWNHYLCLYQSSTEWNPSDGMFGLIDRLRNWVQQGAVNQLDPDGAPLHPPAVYTDWKKGKLIIPKVDTPCFSSPYWFGVAQFLDLPTRIELTAWHEIGTISDQGQYAIAILFSSLMPWEYPTKGDALFSECKQKGVHEEHLFLLLKAASLLTPFNYPIYFILGSPMRGIAGGIRKQHLSVWEINPETADSIRHTWAESQDSLEISTIRAKLEQLLVQVLKNSKISWCPVMEARPEVTIRRDSNTPLSFFQGKSVVIWGCGALGAHIAINLCRVGIRKLILRDYGLVTPGILVRQPYVYEDIGKQKVNALEAELLRINPQLEVFPCFSNIIDDLGKQDFDWTEEADVVIDATASHLVRMRLEMIWNNDERRRIPVTALMVDQTATRLIVAVARGDYSGGAWDLFRKAKLEVLRDSMYSPFADSFFPKDNNKERPFQPEPGCSDPTFVGSSADSAALAGIGLNLIAGALAKGSAPATARLFSQATETPTNPILTSFNFEPDIVLKLDGYEIRIANGALSEMKTAVSQNKRIRSRNIETGGLLWGEWDDAMKVIWVTNASGPPRDSYHSEELFRCGMEGTKDEHEARVVLTRLSVGYIGMWHTHPISRPLPSSTDVHGMLDILTLGPLPPQKNLLFIIGKDGRQDGLGAYLFRRDSGGSTIVAEGLKPLTEVIL